MLCSELRLPGLGNLFIDKAVGRGPASCWAGNGLSYFKSNRPAGDLLTAYDI